MCWGVEMGEPAVVHRRRLSGPVEEIVFAVRRDGRKVPAVAWLPAGRERSSVVLLGHGGSGHKAIDRHRRFGFQLAARAGVASIAIDGPFHGDRAVPGDGPRDYQQRVVDEGPVAVHKGMTGDWLAVVDAVADGWSIDRESVGYLGMSMGARYGLGICSALGPRLQCAVLGQFGLGVTDSMMKAMATDDVLVAAANVIEAPVLFHVQWDDEIFSRRGQLDLFDQLVSPEKQLRARPGRHAQTRPDDENAWLEHITRFLRKGENSAGTAPQARKTISG